MSVHAGSTLWGLKCGSSQPAAYTELHVGTRGKDAQGNRMLSSVMGYQNCSYKGTEEVAGQEVCGL